MGMRAVMLEASRHGGPGLMGQNPTNAGRQKCISVILLDYPGLYQDELLKLTLGSEQVGIFVLQMLYMWVQALYTVCIIFHNICFVVHPHTMKLVMVYLLQKFKKRFLN